MFLDDYARRAANTFRFVAIEARGFDRVFQLGEWRVRIIFRGTIFPKQGRRDHVDAFVRGLRRENSRYEQLQRVPKVQLAMRVWINFWPGFQEVRNPLASRHRAIVLQTGYRFNPGLERPMRKARRRIDLVHPGSVRSAISSRVSD